MLADRRDIGRISTLDDGIMDPRSVVLADTYRILNAKLFDGRLPDVAMSAESVEGAWGSCTGFLDPLSGDSKVDMVTVSPLVFSRSTSRKNAEHALKIILAHEMVHVWQWLVDGPARMDRDLQPLVNHGPNFRLWKAPFGAQGVMLKRGYSYYDLFNDDAPTVYAEAHARNPGGNSSRNSSGAPIHNEDVGPNRGLAFS